MKRKTLLGITIAACGLALSPGAALAQDGWYISGSGGYSGLEDTAGTVANAPTPGNTVRTDNPFEGGYGVQAAVGRQIGRFRLEGELGYSRDTQDEVLNIVPSTGRANVDVKQSAVRVMANAYFELSQGRLRPYVGAGIGVSEIDVRFVGPRAPFPTEAPRLLIDDSDRRFT